MDLKRFDVKKLTDIPPWDWPKETAAALKTMLKDPSSVSEADRVIAAELAGVITVASDEMADTLLAIVQNADEPTPLRAQAAISLGPSLEQCDNDGFEDEYSHPPISKETFERVAEGFRKTFLDIDKTPKQVRRRVLEAAVRAPQDWHADAIRGAYASPDDEWKVTALFCMRWIHGFDKEILEALASPNREVEYEAVQAAGDQELDGAWPHVVKILNSKKPAKPLLLAAIAAAASIRPNEASTVLIKLAASKDREISETAKEAMVEASLFGEDFDDEDADEELNGYVN